MGLCANIFAFISLDVPEHFLWKNRLQEYAQRSGLPIPIYQTINEGAQRPPMFRSTVFVDGTYITSPNTFSNRKAAEQDVASIALASLTQKIKEEGYPIIREVCGMHDSYFQLTKLDFTLTYWCTNRIFVARCTYTVKFTKLSYRFGGLRILYRVDCSLLDLL